MKIYFKEADKAKTVVELFEIGFSPYCDNRYYRSGQFVETYSDLEFSVRQCTQARRSFEELFFIASTYFPETTLEEVAYVITRNFMCFYCDGVKKLVFLREDDTGFCRRLGYCYDRKFVDSTGYSYDIIAGLAHKYITKHFRQRSVEELKGIEMLVDRNYTYVCTLYTKGRLYVKLGYCLYTARQILWSYHRQLKLLKRDEEYRNFITFKGKASIADVLNF